jgi:undecaprenyl-diphosphatase
MACDPRTVTLGLALTCTVSFLVLACVAWSGGLLPGDQAVFSRIAEWRHPALEQPMRILSTVGSGAVLIPFTMLIALVLWRCRYRNALIVPLIAVAGVILEAVTKWIVHRPRPKNVGYGFPSGHVVGSVIVFGLLAYLIVKAGRDRSRGSIAIAAGTLTVAGVAFSRLYFNAHWLSDILGGLTGGLAIVLASMAWLGPRLCAKVEANDELEQTVTDEPRPSSSFGVAPRDMT